MSEYKSYFMAPPGQPETFLNPSTIEKTFSLNFRGFLLIQVPEGSEDSIQVASTNGIGLMT